MGRIDKRAKGWVPRCCECDPQWLGTLVLFDADKDDAYLELTEHNQAEHAMTVGRLLTYTGWRRPNSHTAGYH